MLTTDTVAQALERADPEKLNCGADAAKTAIEMVNVMRLLKKDVTGTCRLLLSPRDGSGVRP